MYKYNDDDGEREFIDDDNVLRISRENIMDKSLFVCLRILVYKGNIACVFICLGVRAILLVCLYILE